MSYATAYRRWVGVGPYYAMFPVAFAEDVVSLYTVPGERVLDPFAGRATSVFVAAAKGRPSVGIEINPVGWVYGKTKLTPASAESVKTRLKEIIQVAQDYTATIEGDIAEFFHLCFTPTSLCFLQACRDLLMWQNNDIDRTLMALILIDLHGNRRRSFSNQMSQSKAMSPDYSVKWWRENEFTPPEHDIESFLIKKIKWRYAKGTPETVASEVLLGDSCDLLGTIQEQTPSAKQQSFTLLFTSPPYIGVTDYYRDQWLRLWMLGGKPSAGRTGERHKGAFASSETYRSLLLTVFQEAAEIMSRQGYVYVRTDARPTTFEITQETLRIAFPRWRERIVDRPAPARSQTARFGDTKPKPGEKDIILAGPAT